MKHVIAVILFAIIITSVFGENIIALRMDDYGLNNYEFNKKLFELHEKYDIPISVGVIPFDENGKGSLDARETTLLIKYIKKGIVDVNLHGYNHKNNLPEEIDGASEFYSMPKEIQMLWINRGKRYLETILGIEVTGFIPPFNTYDNNTLNVLDSLNFNYISSACYGLIPRKNLNENIKHIPYTCLLKDFEKINLSENENSCYIVLFHESDFEEKASFSKYEFLLGKLSKSSLTNFVSLSKLSKLNKFSSKRYLSNQYKNHFIISKSPFGIKKINKYYQTNNISNIDFFFVYVSFFVPYLISFIFGFLTIIIFKFKKRVHIFFLLAIILSNFLMFYYFFLGIHISFKFCFLFFYFQGLLNSYLLRLLKE